jgi:RNA polymerase sigma-70 factor (ECF subfamily)
MPLSLGKINTHPTDAGFEATHWTTVLKAGQVSSPEAGEALEKLCQIYWPPLYAFVRRRGLSAHDAQESVQGFFADFLQRDWSLGLEPQKGRFRTFLLAAMENFLNNQWHASRAQKRGGGNATVSLDIAAAEEFYRKEPAGGVSTHVYDRAWANALVGHVFAQLRAVCNRAGKGDLFEELRQHIVSGQEPGHAPAIAARLGMSQEGVRQARSRLRRQFRELLRQAVAATVEDPADVEAEARYLIAVCGLGQSV